MATPEEASDYISRTNFKTVIEWMTAEVILNRPDDPMVFCRNLLDQKIDGRGGVPFSPEQPSQYVRDCYEEASNLADEHGRIHGKVVTPVSTSSNQQMEQMGARMGTLERLIEASRVIADCLDPFEATAVIVQQLLLAVNADRATIFVMTPDRRTLKLMTAEGATDITVPVGQGIAGGVAATGEGIVIPDAYADDRFDSSFDSKTGYKTCNIMCQPIRNNQGDILGVVQVINKNEGDFTEEDVSNCRILTAQAGICLKNAESYRAQMLVQEKLRSVTDLVRAMQGDMGINSLVFTMTSKAPLIVEAERGTIFVVDEKKSTLVSMQGEANFSIPLSKQSIATSVANTGELINIADAYADERFNQESDKQSGFTTRTILCMPIQARVANKLTVVGVIQLINKGSGAFNADDIDMMSTFLDMAGPILVNSQLYNRRAEESDANELTGSTSTARPSAQAPTLSGFVEEEEEEEEEEA